MNEQNIEMPPIPQSMLREPKIKDLDSVVIKVEAIKISYRQHNAGNIIAFRLHPDENDRAISNIKLGSPVVLVVAEIKE